MSFFDSLWSMVLLDGWRLLLAVMLGGIVGYERALRDKPAGFRTNTLICLGACLFSIVSARAGDAAGFDHTRIAAQVVSGVGFLGAGTILHHRGNVLGLTTAATIWMVAALGVAVGLGASDLAVLTTILVLLVFFLLGKVGDWIDRTRRVEVLRIGLQPGEEARDGVTKLLSDAQVSVRWSKHTRAGSSHRFQWKISGDPEKVESLIHAIISSPDVEELDY